MARARLPAYRDRRSVASVALRCGFPSLNQFAQAYPKRFGKLTATMLGRASVIPMRPKVVTRQPR
jgi:transcriptional regulator GlxA family with amidase domain